MAFELPPPQDDGHFIADVGAWSADKHHYLRRYIDAFVTAMRGKRWAGLHYLDLFAGPGIERIDSARLDWGSPLIAAQAPTRFSRLHLCERNRRRFDALLTRLEAFPQPNPPQLFCEDANEAVDDVVRAIPPRALALAFLDPYGLHLHFDTLRKLAARRIDLPVLPRPSRRAAKLENLCRTRRLQPRPCPGNQ